MWEYAGKIVGGRYRLIEPIGKGGFGLVCKAEHTILGKLFAVKFLHREYTKEPKLIKRFEKEARGTAKLGHPNIVDVIDFGEDPEIGYYFVMEYLIGETLSERLKREGALRQEIALPMLTHIASALSSAHSKDIVHRDLKPENIFLLTTESQVDFIKVLDFGVAAMLGDDTTERITRAATLIGTPFYMAPEQALGHPIDHRIDIYSFGILMYKVLTGEVPFKGPSGMSVLMKHVHEQPLPPSKIKPNLNPEFDAIVMKCLQKQKEARYQNMDEIISEFIRMEKTFETVATYLISMPKLVILKSFLRRKWKYFAFLSSTLFLLLIVLFMVNFSEKEKILVVKEKEPTALLPQTRVEKEEKDIHQMQEVKASEKEIRTKKVEDIFIKKPVQYIKLIIESIPREAYVYSFQGDEKLGKTPYHIIVTEKGKKLKYLLVKKGYLTQPLIIDTSKIEKDERIKIELKPFAKPKSVKKKKEVDPFDKF